MMKCINVGTPRLSLVLILALAPAFMLAVACGGGGSNNGGSNGDAGGQTYVDAGDAQTSQDSEGGGEQTSPVASLALGQSHTCAAVEAGTVHCWGIGGAGQLGDGTGTDRRSASQATGLTDIESVFAGSLTTCALASDGKAWCWGQRPGDSTGTDMEPTPISAIDGAVDLDIGQVHTCAAHPDGGVSCWGNLGFLTGDSDIIAEPMLIDDFADVEQIGVGSGYTCALRNDKQVACLGNHPALDIAAGEEPIDLYVVPDLDGVVEVAAGHSHVCARLDDGTVSCWGTNYSGELGRGVLADTPGTYYRDASPVVNLDGVVSLAAGQGFNCAARDDGTVWCWGESGNYPLGEAVTDGSRTPEPVQVAGVSDAVEIKAGHSSACALRSDASVLCWGNGTDTDGGIRPSATPIPFHW
jgi:alpha-tubulin suppressor-like RCC1 family protein